MIMQHSLNQFSVLIVAVLAANLSVQWWLANRHLRHVRAHREQVPPAFSDAISLETHKVAAEYTMAKVKVGMVDSAIGAILLLGWTIGGGLDLLNGWWTTHGLSPLWTGCGFILSAFFIFGLLDLPMSAYRTFVIEEKFGFNKTTVRLFVTDTIKQTLIVILLGLPLVASILWLMQEAGGAWWIYAWLLWAGFSLVLIWLYPVVIAPLFNKFSPLDNAELRARIGDLLHRNGLHMKGVMVMDGSRRSGHVDCFSKTP